MSGQFDNYVKTALRATASTKPSERLVLAVLAAHANRERVAWPSQETLSAFTGLHIRNVRRALTSLEKRGEIEKLQDGRGRKSSRYLVSVAIPGKRTLASGLANSKPGISNTETGQIVRENRTPAPSKEKEEILKTHACVRGDCSDFLEKGLAALAAHHPDVAASWAGKILNAQLSDGALLVTTNGAYAAHVLRNDYADALLNAFIPTMVAGRIFVEPRKD